MQTVKSRQGDKIKSHIIYGQEEHRHEYDEAVNNKTDLVKAVIKVK